MSEPLREIMDNRAFKTKPFAHQLRALEASSGRAGFAYFMDPGLGKSKVVIDEAQALYARGELEALVVVAPNNVHENWAANELPAHCLVPFAARTYRASLSPRALAVLRERQGTGREMEVLCVNVDGLSSAKARSLVEHWLRTRRCMLVVDESTRIKNHAALRTKFLLSVAPLARWRRILSGTPVTKGAEDLYSQFEFLERGCLGHRSFYAYRASYCVMGGFENRQVKGYQHLDDLERRLAPHVFRARKEECLDLPPKTYQRVPFELSPEHRRLYDAIRREALEVLDDLVGQEGADRLILEQATTRVLRLQQVACGIDPLTGDFLKGECARLGALEDRLVDVSSPAIIWCRFRKDAARVKELLGDRCLELHGGVPQDQRTGIVARFQALDRQFLVATPHAAGIGITLTAAQESIYYSTDYDLELRLQSEDRNHRIGQAGAVLVTDLEAKGTVDGRIIRCLRSKKRFAEEVLRDPRMPFMEEA